MGSVAQLNKLVKMIGGTNCTGDELMDILSNSNSSAPISQATNAESKNTLSKILSDIQTQTKSINNNNSQNANNSRTRFVQTAQSVEETEVDELQDILKNISYKNNQTAVKIMNVVRYLSSPLRLILKQTMMMKSTEQDKLQYLNHLRMSDQLKADLFSMWNDADTFGLCMLVKISKISQVLSNLIHTHDDYVKCFKPLASTNPQHMNIAFYLYNLVMNYQPQNAVHQIYQNRETQNKEDDENSQFGEEATQDLQKKLAFELNNYALVCLRRRVTLRFIDGTSQTFQPIELLDTFFKNCDTSENPTWKLVGRNMKHWLENETTNMVGGRKHFFKVKKQIKKNRK